VSGPPLRVLVVDDSAVVRQTMIRLLTTRGGMEVTVAADPLFALAKMRRERPDVLVLDLDLPRMDGLSFLARIMADDPLPVVICSAIAADRSDAAIAALELGALEIVLKPRVGVRDFLEESAVILVDAVRAAAAARPRLGRRRHDARAAPPRVSDPLSAPRPTGPLPSSCNTCLRASPRRSRGGSIRSAPRTFARPPGATSWSRAWC